MKRYFKLFLFITSIIFIYCVFIYSIYNRFYTGLYWGIIWGLTYGFLFTIISAYIHTRVIKKKGYEISEKTMDVHQKRKLKLKLPYRVAYNLCLESINSLPKARLQKQSISQGKIDVKSGMGWNTLGEKISFGVRKIDDDRTQIIVSSRPVVRTTLIDYGKNLDNVDKISNFLKKRSNRSSFD